MTKANTATTTLAWLERHGSKRVAAGMARYGITTTDRVVGISVVALRL